MKKYRQYIHMNYALENLAQILLVNIFNIRYLQKLYFTLQSGSTHKWSMLMNSNWVVKHKAKIWLTNTQRTITIPLCYADPINQ